MFQNTQAYWRKTEDWKMPRYARFVWRLTLMFCFCLVDILFAAITARLQWMRVLSAGKSSLAQWKYINLNKRGLNPANTIHWPSAGLMLVRRRRRRANINAALGRYSVFAGKGTCPSLRLSHGCQKVSTCLVHQQIVNCICIIRLQYFNNNSWNAMYVDALSHVCICDNHDQNWWSNPFNNHFN